MFKLAYDGDPKAGKVNMVTFQLNRPVTSGTGQISQQAITVNAPLMALVPIPALPCRRRPCRSRWRSRSTVDTSSTTASAGSSFGGTFWGFTASISGSVTTSSSNTRSTDHSAKYDISARATQQPPAEGMSRLNQIFASVIEPIPTGGK
ncbi:DUF2589 domain-containing protein [Nannocystis pusilla]|uniref:DUF2589 domain-containing protein n=1 Tax=Nannocystis pusilla TaxID=889268 RepID=UPI003B83468C